MMLEIHPILTQCALFKELNENEINDALQVLSASHKQYQKGSYVYHAGDITTSFGLVLTGFVHIIKEDYWGNRTLLTHCCAGSLFAEAYACAKIPMAVSVIAATDCDILHLDMSRLSTHENNACTPLLLHNLMMILANKNVLLSSQIGHLSQRKLRDKLLSYLSEQADKQNSPSFDIPYNRQELADLLCVDRSALSAELSRLKQEGILDYHKQHFTLF